MSIQIASSAKIFICITPLDFRNGFNGTAAACRLKMNQNPLDGGLFVFINRSRTIVRLYLFDGHGELMISKRVVAGRFFWWKKDTSENKITVEHIQMLLRGGDPKKIIFPDLWKE